MSNKSRVRARWIRFWILFSVSISAFFYAPVQSLAAISTGSAKSVTVTYNNTEDACWEGNTYLPWNSDIEFSNDGAYNNQDYKVFWYKGKNLKLFDSESQYYGYQVKVTRTTNTSCSFSNADANFWCVGTAGQLMNGESRGGIVTSSSFTAWVTTDNSIQAVHMAPYFHFTSYDYVEDSDYSSSCGTYKINCKYTVTYTGYKTVGDYTAAMSNIQTELENQTTEMETQTSELKKQNTKLDNLTNGFDSSAGTAANTQLQGSVDNYGSMEGTLFDSVSSGLSDFDFFNLNSVPAMVTGLSFISSIMSSWFIAAGGSSGVGIVLSVLFSVMIVSMLLGLYKHYQSRGGKGD